MSSDQAINSGFAMLGAIAFVILALVAVAYIACKKGLRP